MPMSPTTRDAFIGDEEIPDAPRTSKRGRSKLPLHWRLSDESRGGSVDWATVERLDRDVTRVEVER